MGNSEESLIMARIKLTGKYAVGKHEYAVIDDDLYESLNQWKWKAKPNGGNNNVYAVRNEKTASNKDVTIRMHRVVIGYSGRLDIDHMNHDSLDNRRENLRVVTRSTNVLNCRVKSHNCTCIQCGDSFQAALPATSPTPAYCGSTCIKDAQKIRRRLSREANQVATHAFLFVCPHCGKTESGRVGKMYCSSSCRKAAKWRRQSESNSLPKSQVRAAEYSRERRRLIKAGQWKS